MASPSSSKSPPFPRSPNSLQATPQLPHEPYDDLYEGYNDYDQQLHAYGASSGQVESGETLRSKTDVFEGYDHVAGYSPSSSTSNFQGPKMNLFNGTPIPQNAVSLWRLPSAGRTTCAHSVITSAAPTDASRPLTAVRAAGYSSTKGAKFDPMEHQTARSSPFADVKKDVDSNHALKCHNMEHAVNQLLEASATAGLSMDCESRETFKWLSKKLRKQERRRGLCVKHGSRQA